MEKRLLALLFGITAGSVFGLALAQHSMGRHRRDLFSGRPLRRLAALGHLSGNASVDTVRLLQDYVAWESQPMLKKRAAALARRMEQELG
jgi:hypothetical protein